MKKELVEPAVKAIDAMIADELASASPARYGNIQKLCKHAHDLTQLAARRVKDVVPDNMNNLQDGGYMAVYNGDIDIAVEDNMVEAPVRVGRNGDQADLTREMIAAIAAAANRQPQVAPVSELAELINVRKQLEAVNMPVVGIDKQIAKLLKGFDQPEAVFPPAALEALADGVNND